MMSDPPTEDSDPDEGARMKVEPNTVHETDDGIFLDCPQCGSNVSFVQLVNQGRCTGYLEEEITEAPADTEQQEGCDAELTLELVWHS